MLARAVRSVLAQSLSGWELIVIDDASTDGTPRVLAEFAARDPRITVVTNKKNNYPDISKTLNDGITKARGKYIARLDDDDYWVDDRKLEKQSAFLEQHPDYMVVGSGMIIVDAAGRELSRYFKNETDAAIRKHALFANPFSHTTVMFRADAARAVHGYGDWRYAEDWDLWLKLGARGKFYNLPEYTTAYTLAGQNKSFTHQRPQSRMILQLITVHRKEYPGFWRAYALNGAQYLYSFLPVAIRRPLHSFLAGIKRKAF